MTAFGDTAGGFAEDAADPRLPAVYRGDRDVDGMTVLPLGGSAAPRTNRIGGCSICRRSPRPSAPVVSARACGSSSPRGDRVEAVRAMLHVTEHIAIDEREFEERFVRASGPGGQNVNKVSTAVELRFDVAKSSLPDDVKTRLMTLAGNKLTADGVLVIDSREHRTQAMNREAARARLVGLVLQATVRPKRRRATRPGKAARERRLTEKKHRADVKTGRRRGSGD